MVSLSLSLSLSPAQVTFWAINRSPLFIGLDLRSVKKASDLQLLTNPEVLEVTDTSSFNRQVSNTSGQPIILIPHTHPHPPLLYLFYFSKWDATLGFEMCFASDASSKHVSNPDHTGLHPIVFMLGVAGRLVWAANTPAHTTSDPDMYVALLNSNTGTAMVAATFADLGIHARRCDVRDLWARQPDHTSGVGIGSVFRSLGLHGVALFRVGNCTQHI